MKIFLFFIICSLISTTLFSNEISVSDTMQKHSKAKLVTVSFEKKLGKLNFNYSDNGVDLNSLKTKNGLVNMETRINFINGTITFTSNLNKGFKAIISFK